jgi:hypothetical protein
VVRQIAPLLYWSCIDGSGLSLRCPGAFLSKLESSQHWLHEELYPSAGACLLCITKLLKVKFNNQFHIAPCMMVCLGSMPAYEARGAAGSQMHPFLFCVCALDAVSQAKDVIVLDGAANAAGDGNNGSGSDLLDFTSKVQAHWKATWQYHFLSFEVPKRSDKYVPY